MLRAISTPSLYIYIFFECVRERRVGAAGRKWGSQFLPYRGALKKFLKVEVHNQNEVNDSSIFLCLPKILRGILLQSYKFRETGLTEA